MIASGTYRLANRYPLVPLSDAAGDIRTFGFAEAPAAIAALKQGSHFGKLVIDFAR